MTYLPIPGRAEAAARQVIGAAIEVHRLGPSFLERIYQEALCPSSCALVQCRSSESSRLR